MVAYINAAYTSIRTNYNELVVSPLTPSLGETLIMGGVGCVLGYVSGTGAKNFGVISILHSTIHHVTTARFKQMAEIRFPDPNQVDIKNNLIFLGRSISHITTPFITVILALKILSPASSNIPLGDVFGVTLIIHQTYKVILESSFFD